VNINVGEVWFANFPLEEDPTVLLRRPVVVLDVEKFEVLSVKVTKTDPREEDEFDTPIVFWQNARLRFKSTARVSKTTHLPKSQFIHKIGDLHNEDLLEIQEQFMKFIVSQE
jgi:hypothetical protein